MDSNEGLDLGLNPVKSVLSVCELVSEQNPLALSQATYYALRHTRTELALALFEAMKQSGAPIRPHYYWPLLTAARTKGEHEVWRLVAHSRDMAAPMDPATLCSYVLGSVCLEAPTALLRRLQEAGFTLSEVFSPVLSALISDGRLEEACQLCRAHPTRLDCGSLVKPLVSSLVSGSPPTRVVDLVKMFVQSCRQPDDWVGLFLLELFTNQRVKISHELAEAVVKALSDAGLRCSLQAVEVIGRQATSHQPDGTELPWFEALTKMVDEGGAQMSTDKMSHYLRHPRNMNLEELRCHLGELKAKKMNMRGVLRLLLLKYCQQGHLKGVGDTLKELETGGYEFSSGMNAALLDFYIKTDQLDEATKMFHQLGERGDFNLDEHKVIDLATLLVARNQTAAAISMLDKRRKLQPIRATSLPKMSRNCHKLLVATSRGNNPEDTRAMLESLVMFGYCDISNKMLGPLVKTYLLRDDTEAAVAEFVSCVDRYKFTPLLHELMCHLVSKAGDHTPADELIKQVLASAGQVRGIGAVRCDYLIALADVGNMRLLGETVKESAREINYRTLLKRAQRLVDVDKPKAIKNLIAVLRQHCPFNLAPLFTGLLHIHCRHGDTRGALDLWDEMQLLACRPEPTFVTTLGGLLRSHNTEVPASLTAYDSGTRE